MTEEQVDKQRANKMQPANLQEAVEMLRGRLSSVRMETMTADSDTAIKVRFVGDGTNLEERQLLVKNLTHYLPPTLSIIGVKTGEERSSGNRDESDAGA